MLSLERKKTALALFALALVLRVYNLQVPFAEPYNSVARQAIVASVARNFTTNGFNFLYPEIDENGRGPYLYNAEMPFYSYAMALGYKLAGAPREWVARLVSVLFSLSGMLFLFLLVRRLYDERTALWVWGFLAVSPLFLALSRSIQPESCMFFAATGMLYFFERYARTDDKRWFFVSAAFAFLAVATKIYNAYLLLPVMYLGWRKEGAAIFRNPLNYAYVAIAMLPLFWYAAMFKAGQDLPLAYVPYDFSSETRGPAGKAFWQLFAPEQLLWFLKIFSVHLLSPLGALLFLVGIFSKPSEANKLFYAWSVSVVLLMLVMWRTVIDHSYYLYPLAPVAALFIAKGAVRVVDALKTRNKALVGVVAVVLVAGELFSLGYFYRGLYWVPEKVKAMVRAGETASRILPPDAILAASFEGSTIQLYYADRKGWAFDITQKSSQALIEDLEALRRKGAEYLLLSSLKDLERVGEFEKYLRENYRLVPDSPDYLRTESPDYLLFSLAQPIA